MATGARPRRASARGSDALTPRERRIAQMASTGLGNREIAEALFITTKTVETHLGRAYRKLEVQGRTGSRMPWPPTTLATGSAAPEQLDLQGPGCLRPRRWAGS